MIDKPEFVRPDIINQLKDAHENLETMSPDEIRTVLVEAIETMRTFRTLLEIRDDILLEDMPTEGKA
ncbi:MULTISPECIES: hypothetical protein [unclassified Phyllobacterium]|uniref:hypothetical protein n=1 Tax=unclassified Phyllobacterium TaxID=2638441 RepID=UPI003012D797